MINFYKKIKPYSTCIQMNDNPDTLCSAIIMQDFLKIKGKESDLIFSGELNNPNLKIILDTFDIEIYNIPYNPPNREYDLSISMNGQYRNPDNNLYTIEEIQSDGNQRQIKIIFNKAHNEISLCTTLFNLFREYGMLDKLNKKIGTLMYFGLYKSSQGFMKPLQQSDRDMISYLDNNNLVNRSLLKILCKENITPEELKIVANTLSNYKISDIVNIAVIEAERCSHNLLSYISDILLGVTGVTIVVALTEESISNYRFAIRSCDRYIKAIDICQNLVEVRPNNLIGYGGGGNDKAGGTLSKRHFEKFFKNLSLIKYIEQKTLEVYNKYERMDFRNLEIDTSILKPLGEAKKIPIYLRFLRLNEIFNESDTVKISTIEGDVITEVNDNLLMVGVEGEIYPIDNEYFHERYTEIYHLDENKEIESDKGLNYLSRVYSPIIRSVITNREYMIKDLSDFGVCLTNPLPITAYELMKPVKLITDWDDENPHTGEVGDILAINKNGSHYIINRKIFNKTYKIY